MKKKEDPDNYLLWLLASHDLAAKNTVADLEDCLKTLEKYGAVNRFSSRLRQYQTVKLDSVLTELQIPRDFGKLGFKIELEPQVGGADGVPDFVASDHIAVFFEITHIFEEETERLNKVKLDLRRRLQRIDEPFVFSLTIPPDLGLSEVPPLVSDIREHLQKAQSKRGSRFQVKLTRRGTSAKMTVHGTSSEEYGHLSAIVSGGPKAGPGEISSKISKKVRQLPGNERGVIVVDTGGILVDREILQDALYGADVYHFDRRTARLVEVARSEKRVFLDGRNKRVCAVYCYHQYASDTGLSTVDVIFHNPFANKEIPADFFGKPGTRQFVPVIEDSDTIRMDWLKR